ncbi:MAG TPA: hypothetical protein VI321_11950 [Burkholderiales bacterium]
MKKLLIGVVSLLMVGMASAQAQTRIRGTITDVQGDVLKVRTTDGRDVEVKLAPDAGVVTPKKVSAQDFKEGSYVGVTSVKDASGHLVAKRVHALGPQVPQMHGNWDSIPNSMMTNATIAGMAKTSGGTELTMKHKGGEEKILTNAQTEYYDFDNGSRADLKKGESIFANSKMGDDGKFVAPRIVVSKNGVKPPQ